MQQLLMIEDDTRLAQMVGEYLERSGFGVTHAWERLRKVDANFRKLPAADSITLPGYYWYGSYGYDGVNFTPSQRSIEIPQGLFGVSQVYVD